MVRRYQLASVSGGAFQNPIGYYSVSFAGQNCRNWLGAQLMVVDAPRFRNMLSTAGGNLSFQINTSTGSTYRLQTTTNMIDWYDVDPPVMASNAFLQWSHTMEQPQQFFRIVANLADTP
jgi:hypothetical protein